ncbi:ATP-binding protein [Skermanella mucosa]|uniref:ATP-binding protein n=1 Tax=Skermanella mucosa TaxID=1789672 RepID=UPI00192B55A9|nr:ATP-binding protein [Skermanella mucosa]UEM20601.1 ATP-binding protein [Skermanella mucosa]
MSEADAAVEADRKPKARQPDKPSDALTGLLPKLPQLDAGHVKAIGGTLPGRLLGRTAALLALVAMVFGWWGLIDSMLPSWAAKLRNDQPELLNGMVFGLPLAIVVLQLGRELFENAQARRMRERVIKGEVRDPGYFRLVPYTARDRERFARADGAPARVLAWIEDAATPVLYFSGDSGTGKSSLLEAHVVPSLRETGWLVVSVRSYADPAAALETALRTPDLIWKHPPEAGSLHDLIGSAARKLAREKRRLVLLLDQFEEFLILHDDSARRQFLDLLAELDRMPVAGLRLVLVLRSEYEARIPESGLPPLMQGGNWFKLGAFTEPMARTFLKDSGLELAPGAFDRLLAGAAALEATRGLFRPIVLNLLGLVIARHAGKLPDGLDPEKVIQGYLKENLSAAEISADAPRVLAPMITEAGTKRPLEESVLAAETGLPLGRVRHCLLHLAQTGMVRPLGQHQVVWEISHDFIATQIGLLLGRLRPSTWRWALSFLTPLVTAAWLMTAALLAWYWPKLLVWEAITALSSQGFNISGDHETGYRIDSLDLREGAASVLAEHLSAFDPLISLGISGDGEAKTLPSLNGLAKLQQLSISSNGSLQSLPSLDALTNLNELALGLLAYHGTLALEQLAALKVLNVPDSRGAYEFVRRIQAERELLGLNPLKIEFWSHQG